jgi:enoyl-CoA hydratase/carnithine racemase
MAEASVTYRVADGVGTISLNRPHVLNALDVSLVEALADATAAAAADPAVWVVVVRGAGRAFCSGMDRKALSSGAIGEAFYRHWTRGLDRLEDMDKLTVAVLHGYSIGGGLQLAVACDVRLAAADAVIGLGATQHALIPDGSILRLARIIGLGRAKELTLLNDHISADEARAMGLVNWVAPADQVDTVLAGIVDKAMHTSRTATGHAKRLLHASFHTDPRAMIEDVMRAQAECMASWEMALANRGWDERREVRYYPTPADGDGPAQAPRPSGGGPGG